MTSLTEPSANSRDLIKINLATLPELMAMDSVTAMDTARCCADPEMIADDLLMMDATKHTVMIMHGLTASKHWETDDHHHAIMVWLCKRRR